MKDPLYQAQIQEANHALVEEVGKMKQINVMNHIAETIEHCAELMQTAKDEEIHVRNIQDLRYVQMTMLESIKLYGDIILKAQQFAKVEENPELLRPTVNVHVKSALIDMLKGGMSDEQRTEFVDRLRNGIRVVDQGGLPGDTPGGGFSSMDREQSDIEG
jgi:hypothetical protein